MLLATDRILAPGVALWVWRKREPVWADLWLDCALWKTAGLIFQAGTTSYTWSAPHVEDAIGRGLQVTIGVGMDGGDATAIVRCVVAALRDPRLRVMLDWESPALWENAAGHALAQRIVDDVKAQCARAGLEWQGRVTMCPWWAPLFYLRANGQRVVTHPGAPYVIFRQLAAGAIFVQAYGANEGATPEPIAAHDGRSQAMLAWARSETQYHALGTPASLVRAAGQGYNRTLWDQVAELTAETDDAGTYCVWDWEELDAHGRDGQYARRLLADRSFVGPDAVRHFQASPEGQRAHLVVDNKCGPLTFAALQGHPAVVATHAPVPLRAAELATQLAHEAAHPAATKPRRKRKSKAAR